MTGFELTVLEKLLVGFSFGLVGIASCFAGLVFCDYVIWPLKEWLHK